MAAERPPIPFLFCKQGLLVPRNHADQLKATLAAENVALQRERTKSRRDNEHHQTISKSEAVPRLGFLQRQRLQMSLQPKMQARVQAHRRSMH